MISTALTPKNFKAAFNRVFKSRLINSIFILIATVAVSSLFVSISIYDRTSYPEEITANLGILFGVITAIIGFYSLSNAFRMFKEIYKKQSCDAYFSSPISRTEYYVANYAYGALVDVLCYAVAAVITVSTLGAAGFSIDMSQLLHTITGMVLAQLAIYSAFVMCAVVSGKHLHYIVLSLICLFCTPVFFSGIVAELNSIWGLRVESLLFVNISPVFGSVYALGDENFSSLTISVVEIIVCFTAGLVSFKRRKAEVAEMTVSGNVVVCTMLALLIGAVYFDLSAGNGVIGLFFGIAASLVATLIFGKLLYKKAFTRQTAITTAVVCGFCTVLSVIVLTPAFNSYVKYVPEASEIESIDVVSAQGENYISSFNLFDTFTQFEENSWTNPITVDDKQSIKTLTNLHKKIVSDPVIKASKSVYSISVIKSMFFSDDYYDGLVNNVEMRIRYKLKNGRTVERTYIVNYDLIDDEYRSFYTSDKVIEKTVDNMFNMEILAVTSSVYCTDDNDEYSESDTLLKNVDIEKLREAYKKDVRSIAKKTDIDYNGTSYFISDGDISCDITIYYLYESDLSTDKDYEKARKMTEEQVVNNPWESSAIDMKYYSIYDYFTNTIEYIESYNNQTVPKA